MSDEPVLSIVRSVHAHGWLRRPELDSAAYDDTWELPNGQLYAAQKGDTPKLATLVAKPWTKMTRDV